MFYVTTIQSVSNGFAIDTQGRSLSFIGYLNVGAGDTVYTDGKVIFGNAPPKGAPMLIDEPRGIPVVGNQYLLSEEKKPLRGYFTQQGKYKKYNIKATDWLVNDKKKYEHDRNNGVIDAEIDEGGKLILAVKTVTQLAGNDSDYHWGFYARYTTGIFAPINFGRIAAVLPEDDYSEYVRGFQNKPMFDGFNSFYRKDGRLEVFPSYDEGYYPGFQAEVDAGTAGFFIPLKCCYFFLRSQNLDYSMSDGTTIKACILDLSKTDSDANIAVFHQIKIADLLKDFEDAARKDVEVPSLNSGHPGEDADEDEGQDEEEEEEPTERESVKHIKSRAIVRNVKLLPNHSAEIIIDAEIWASNTFYNETEERDHSTDPPTIETTPFHISSTVSHNRLLLKFKVDSSSNVSYETISSWKFLYPLKLRDTYFGGYYFGERESTVVQQGAWIIRTMHATAGVVDGKQRYYYEIWRDYYSQLESDAPEYDTPLFDIVDDFNFPVQDDYRATFEQPDDDDADITDWKLKAVRDEDGNNAFSVEDLPDDVTNDTEAYKWNMSLIKLKNGDYLFGIRKDADKDIDGKLFKIPKGGGEVEQVADGLKNFRLRELKNLSKAKK